MAMRKKVLLIEGMTCVNCQNRIEQALRNTAGISLILQGILKIIAGLFMVIMGINMLGIIPVLRKLQIRFPNKLANKISRRKIIEKRPFFVGLLNGLMPCGPMQSMQIIALGSGNPVSGAFAMLMFSLGTVPLMLGYRRKNSKI